VSYVSNIEMFSNILPKKTDLNSATPFVPMEYKKYFNINMNSRQNVVGEAKYLNYSDDVHILLNENCAFKNIATPPHINLYYIMILII